MILFFFLSEFELSRICFCVRRKKKKKKKTFEAEKLPFKTVFNVFNGCVIWLNFFPLGVFFCFFLNEQGEKTAKGAFKGLATGLATGVADGAAEGAATGFGCGGFTGGAKERKNCFSFRLNNNNNNNKKKKKKKLREFFRTDRSCRRLDCGRRNWRFHWGR